MKNTTNKFSCIQASWFSAYLDHILITKGLSRNSLSAYRHDLERFFSFCDEHEKQIGEVDQFFITGFLRHLLDLGLSPRSVGRNLSSIKSLYRFLVSDGLLSSEPSQFVEAPRIRENFPDALTYEETENLLAAIPLSTLPGIRDRAILEFLYSTGCRVSEACGLKLGDIYFDEGFVRLFGKGNKERVVPLGREASYYLSRYIRDVRDKFVKTHSRDYVFLAERKGTPLSRVAVWMVIKKYAKRAGLKKNVHPHTLRHTCATHLLEGGADLRAVQEILGHEDISTTQIYLNIQKQWLKEEYRKYHPRA